MSADIDIRKEVAEGKTVQIANDLVIGDIPEAPKVRLRPERKVEEWNGTPQMYDGKVPKVFVISEACTLQYESKDGSKHRCNQTLQVHRIMNQRFERDAVGTGGQIQYLQDDIKYFKICPIHGPFTLPEFW